MSINYKLSEGDRKYIYFVCSGSKRRRNTFVEKALPLFVRSLNPELLSGKPEPENLSAAHTARDKVRRVQTRLPRLPATRYVGGDILVRRGKPEQSIAEMEVLHGLKRQLVGDPRQDEIILTRDKVKTMGAYTQGLFKIITEVANALVSDETGEGPRQELPGATSLLLIETIYQALDPQVIEDAYATGQAQELSSRVDLSARAASDAVSLKIYDPARPDVVLTQENYPALAELVHSLTDANQLPAVLFEQLVEASQRAAQSGEEETVIFDLSVLQYGAANESEKQD